MKNFIRNPKKLTAVFALTVLLVALFFSASVRGHLMACFDIARGHYEVQTFGLIAELPPDYARWLRERYGIEHRTVADCFVTSSLVSYVSAYNRVVEAAVKSKFGRDVFEESAADAWRAWENRQLHETTGIEHDAPRVGGGLWLRAVQIENR